MDHFGVKFKYCFIRVKLFDLLKKTTYFFFKSCYNHNIIKYYLVNNNTGWYLHIHNNTT